MSKSNTGMLLVAGGAILALSAVVKHGGDIQKALTKLTFKVDSVKIIPVSKTGVTGVGNVLKDIGGFFSNLFKAGKQVVSALATKGQKIGLEVNWQVGNPSDVPIIAKDFSFTGQVLHQGKPLANINVVKAIEIPAHGTANVKLPMALQINNVVSNLLDTFKGKSLSSVAEVTVKGSGYAMGTNFPVDQKFNLLKDAGVAGIGAIKKISRHEALALAKKLNLDLKKDYYELNAKEQSVLRDILEMTNYSYKSDSGRSILYSFYLSLQKIA